MTDVLTVNGVGGLSPLARGNHFNSATRHLTFGPIPARAGQPAFTCAWMTATAAYPRSRGATLLSLAKRMCSEGLSPLARGNRGQHQVLQVAHGPIPARAGQPAHAAGNTLWPRAYPRSRGATDVGEHG